MKRVIGVMPLYDDEKSSVWMLPDYLEAIRAAGGLPVILPPTGDGEEIGQLFDACDGFLMTGGHDVSPALYGQEPEPCCGPCHAVRDAMEQRILSLALEADKPLLGICRGFQLLNVHLGGTLYQDLDAQFGSRVMHNQKPPYQEPCHGARVFRDTPLFSLMGRETIRVNSHHHQGVRTLAPGLVAAAQAEDGLTEGLWLPEKRFVMAVQWHPEYLYPKEEGQLRLFKSLVAGRVL